MKEEDKHYWKKVELEKDMSYTFDKKEECKRCKCTRYRSRNDSSYFLYQRGMALYGTDRPNCFGSVPINEQTID